MKANIILAAITVGLLMIAAGIATPFVSAIIDPESHPLQSDTFRYVYAAGAAILLIGRIFSQYRGDATRLRRLYRIEMWSAVFFCVAAAFLFYDKANLRDPLAFTLAGGLIQVYTSIMIPREIKKGH